MSHGDTSKAVDWQKADNSVVTSGAGRSILGALFSFDLEHFLEFVAEDYGISRALIVSILFFGLYSALTIEIPHVTVYAFQWLVGTSPIWLPISLGVGAWKVFLWYTRSLFLSKQKYSVLDVKLPREVLKSPRAMETALASFWANSGETTFYHRVWKGQVRPYWSLEIASHGGDVHFYVWCRQREKNVVENALYSQYPGIELHEVEDYASKFEYDPKIHQCFCTDHRYEPRNDAYPIKTYVDFELDKDPKEEYRVDPLANVLEFMSNIKPQENIWVQIIFTLGKDKRHKKGTFLGTEDKYTAMVKDEVKAIREASFIKTPEGASRPMPSWAQTEQIRSMERNVGKLPFNVGIRAIYVAEKAYYHGPNYNGVRWLWRPFGNLNYMNQLRPRRGHNAFDYPWQDYKNFRFNLAARRHFDAYRRRSFFYTPWITPHMIMSAEVIATLWHPVGQFAATAGLQRIGARKAEPPPNLPM